MTPAAPPPPGVEPEPPKIPLWRNPFVIAFVIGAFFLTVLPFMQRRFLKAPPPGPSLGVWAYPTPDGGSFGSTGLEGKVWLASFAPDPARRAEFGEMLKHVEDVPGIVLVSFVPTGEKGPEGGPRWFVVHGADDLAMKQFLPAYADFVHHDAGTTLDEWTRNATVGLVDQNGALRGFWADTPLGRGNAINAARLLARYGAAP